MKPHKSIWTKVAYFCLHIQLKLCIGEKRNLFDLRNIYETTSVFQMGFLRQKIWTVSDQLSVICFSSHFGYFKHTKKSGKYIVYETTGI